MTIGELRVGKKYILQYGESDIWTYIGGVKNIRNATLFHFQRSDGKKSWFTTEEMEDLLPYES